MPWHDSLAIAPTLTALAEAGTQLDRFAMDFRSLLLYVIYIMIMSV